MNLTAERRLLQVALLAAGVTAVAFGVGGVTFGTTFISPTRDVTVDGYVRFAEGMLLALGLVYLSSIRHVERRGERIAVVTCVLVLGSLSRLVSVIGLGFPTTGILLSLCGGLIAAPGLWLWQRHLARRVLGRDHVGPRA